MKAISDMLNQLVCTFFFLKHFIKQRECHAFLLTHLSLDRFPYITKFLAYTICTNIQEMKSMFFLYIITYIKTTPLCFNHGYLGTVDVFVFAIAGLTRSPYVTVHAP
jgi:hypothetical protein